MKIKIKIIETLSKVIEVEAEDDASAVQKVRKMYNNEDIVLSNDDFEEAEFYPCNC